MGQGRKGDLHATLVGSRGAPEVPDLANHRLTATVDASLVVIGLSCPSLVLRCRFARRAKAAWVMFETCIWPFGGNFVPVMAKSAMRVQYGTIQYLFRNKGRQVI